MEIKAKSAFEDKDVVQALCYVKASQFRLGLLLNFGAHRLEIKRLVNDHRTYQPETHRRG